MAEKQIAQQQQTIKTKIKLATFVSDTNDTENFDKRLNEFLDTLDNKKRFLNGRNAFAVGENKICVNIWYLQALEPKAVVKPLGKKNATKEK